MENFVPFELADKLKEKGFRLPCIAHYCCLDGNVLKYNITTDYIRGSNVKCLNGENNIYTDAPTISQVLKWLREEKKMHLMIDIWKVDINDTTYKWGYDIVNLTTTHVEGCDTLCANSYEQASLAGIEYVLDNLI